MNKPQLIKLLSKKYSEVALLNYSEFELQLMYCAMTALESAEAKECIKQMEEFKRTK